MYSMATHTVADAEEGRPMSTAYKVGALDERVKAQLAKEFQ